MKLFSKAWRRVFDKQRPNKQQQGPSPARKPVTMPSDETTSAIDEVFGDAEEPRQEEVAQGNDAAVAPEDVEEAGAGTDCDATEPDEVTEDGGGEAITEPDDDNGIEFVDGHATVMRDGVEYDVYDMSARCGMEVVETPADDSWEESAEDDETDETFPDEGVMTDAQAEVLLGLVMDAQMDKGVSAEAPDVADDDIPAVTFRAGDAIEPIGFDAPFVAEHATGEMLTAWHIRLVYDHDMPSGDDEPIVELYDGETGEFVSDYWVSTFCDNSEDREGQGLACRGAEKRFRIMYDDLVGMQELVRPVAAVEAWYEVHKDDMPDHSI